MKTARFWMALVVVLCLGSSWAYADRPTDFYTTVTKNDNQTDAQTDTDIWDPAADKRVVLQAILVSADAAQTVEVEVSNVDVIPPIYLAANTTVSHSAGGAPIYIGATDAVLEYTTTTGANTTIQLVGYEEEF